MRRFEDRRIPFINWEVYKKKYKGKVGYRLPLIDKDGKIWILVLTQEENTHIKPWELCIYPHKNLVHNIYYFNGLANLQSHVLHSLNGDKEALKNDDLSEMRLVRPILKHGPFSFRFFRI